MNANVSDQVGPLDKLLWTVWTFVSWPIVNQKVFIIAIFTLQQNVIYDFKNLNIGYILRKTKIVFKVYKTVSCEIQNLFIQDSSNITYICQLIISSCPQSNSVILNRVITGNKTWCYLSVPQSKHKVSYSFFSSLF